jgi:SmpA / OmlA family
MKTWKFVPILVLAAAACGKKAEEQQAAPAQPAATATPDTAAAMPTPPPAAPVRTSQAAMPTMPAVDEPWTPTDTGAVSPGMTRDQVVAVWGAPVTERTLGAWTYLYYRNGCEASCGTFDVVFLDDGQVVNAIVRGRGHTFTGTSTSPPGTTARPTPPGGAEG